MKAANNSLQAHEVDFANVCMIIGRKKMMIRKTFDVLLYIGLLIGAIIFVKQTIEEYSHGNTSYTITQEPISLSDLPTLTICWKTKFFYRTTLQHEFSPYVYGENVSIDVKTHGRKENTVTLLENKNILVSDGIHIHLSELHLNGSIDCGSFYGTQYFQCFLL